jgi:hypothetical protein
MAFMDASTESERAGILIASSLTPLMEVKGEDAEDTRLLLGMADTARRYISSFSWCGEILDVRFGGGVGGIFAIGVFT